MSDTSALKISPASPDDEAGLIALWNACGLTVSYNDPSADFRFAKEGPASDVLVGKDDAGKIIGSIMVGHDGHRGWFYYVGSHPDAQRGGIGRAMIRAGEDWLRGHGIAKVQLLVRKTNDKVVPFYERLGYEVSTHILMSRWIEKD